MLSSVAADAAGIDAYLGRFVPGHRRQLLRRRHSHEPAVRQLQATVLYVDIVGFTSLTGQMTHNLAVAAEQVAADVNRVLTGIAGIAANHGGEVIHFAGDAAWVGWFVDETADLPQASHLAATAAVAVRDAARSWQLGGRPVDLRASLGAGQLEQFELGGEGDRWHGLLRGAAMTDTVSADRLASAGTIVASPGVRRHLRDVADVLDLPQGYARIRSVVPATPPGQAVRTMFTGGIDGAALPPMLAYRAASGEQGRWSGEFRTCHIVFGRLRVGDGDFGQLHLAVGKIQRALDRSNGTLYQLLTDEKGVAVIAAYGLPPLASGSDGLRALEAVPALAEALDRIGVHSNFGITAGRTFCTIYGSDQQLQFALVGPALNRAARLAEGPEPILADTTIATSLPATVAARALPPRALKGLAEPVPISEIVRKREEARTGVPVGPSRLIGRQAELARGLARIAELNQRRGGLLLIEGDPGTGKSALAGSLLATAGRVHPTARGSADEIERATEYRPWRAALRSLVSDLLPDGRGLSDEALASLGPNRPYAGLMARVLDLPPATQQDSTQPLADEARAGVIRQMVVALLAVSTRAAPVVLLLEDLHWFDSSSLALLTAVLEARLPILVVATSRPDPRVDDLLSGADRERVRLGGLDAAQSAALLAQVAEASSVDDQLAARVQEITSGNPFFVTQLARFLLDSGELRILHDQLTAISETLSLDRSFEARGVPATLEGVVMGRLDALPPADREIVRVSSVLGGDFGYRDLAALLETAPNLTALAAAGILVRRGDEVAFHHAILRDVAYSTLSLADRRRLHGAVARLFAAKPEAAVGQLDAVLAHHLEQAGDLDGAIAHLLRAGTSSLRFNANREALAQHTHGLELLRLLSPDRRGALRDVEIALEFGTGEAAQRLSRYRDAVYHKDAALAALGGAVPSSVAIVPALLREVAVQVAHRRLPWLVRGRRPSARDLRLSAETAELVEIYFYGGESFRSLYAALRALNLAEGGGDTPQLARGFGIVGTIAGFARLGGVARSYGERALDVLSRIDDATAAWWVPLVVGVSRLSAGDLAMASRLMEMTATAAERIRDRRHWRDAIGNQSIIMALRGDWIGGLALSEQQGATALEDRDTRYIVAAAREQAYFLLQLGRLDEAEIRLARVRDELDRGFQAEAVASRQDLHAIGAAIALARGDGETARREAEAGLAVFRSEAKGGSFPNMFWSLELLFDAFMTLAHTGGDVERSRNDAWTLVRALRRHAAAHRIGRPAALRARGLYERRFGWAGNSGRWQDRAAETARALGMAYSAEPARSSGEDAPLARFIPAWLRKSCPSR